MDFTWHLAFAFFIRICLIFFAQWYDDSSTGVHYTDVDYTVFTNAAEHILVGDSPYMRPTYRYTPLIAVLLIPNVLLNCWGKLLFSMFDLATAIVIQRIVSKSHPDQSNFCAHLWLYNPLSIIISTRGNADSISCFLVLLTLYAHIQNNYLLSAICFATSVHVRIYPIIFGFTYYLNIDSEKNNMSIARTIFYAILPTRKKIMFVVVFVLSLIVETLPWYYLYGQKFLDESYLYHISRLDVRHNFSVYFYVNYLLSGMDEMLIMSFHSLATKLPLLILLGSISLKFSRSEELPFCLFCLTFVMVTFNSVLTSQYFVWFASFLPLCYSFHDFTFIEIINLIMIWAVPQIGWLAFAYCLEFLGINTFKLIWVQSLMFFIANLNVLWIFIDNYKYNKLKKKL
ncbi:Mannosyltransferase, DXD [Cinara cedri]|uniref:GPI alpha-1,4-mannosyltransferase I, catalytic subunit n=1 Tax=Cinara cedri TaxID=506608 RepID=A0A5E4MF64_9HEMI|nr:Mannosyltransferase, DXD [Cinara cedri]